MLILASILPEVKLGCNYFLLCYTKNTMITVYSTPTCAFCYALKEYLRDKKVDFTEKDISSDKKSQEWVLNHTGQLAVPVSDIDGNVVIGFDRPKIEALLRAKKLI